MPVSNLKKRKEQIFSLEGTMKNKIRTIMLAVILCCSFGLDPASSWAQIARPSQILRGQGTSQRLSIQNPPSFHTQGPRMLTTTSPDILWVQCPAEATGLDPAVACGYLPVPMHREQPEKTEKIRIYFEIY